MQLDSSLVLLLLGLFAAGGKGSSSSAPGSSSPSSSAPPTALGPGGEQERIRTGESPWEDWARYRFGLLRTELARIGVPAPRVNAVALSLLAQWAHECARGRAEFNWNMGGWRARPGDPYFQARDVQSGRPMPVKWTAYYNPESAIADHVSRLQTLFSGSWKMLLDDPASSAWVEDLGARGYYDGNSPLKRGNYARAWATHRTELGKVLAP